VSHFLSPLFEPGFFESAQVHAALVVGALAATVAATVGSFAVLRGQSFAGEALADIGTAGGSGAFLVGVGPLWGFVAMGAAAAAVMELLGIQRPRGRDLATGIVLGAGLGLAALFLYLDASRHNAAGATVTILFGSIFVIASSMTPAIVALSVAAVAIVLALFRPLLLASTSPELAAARGLRVRLIGALYLLALVLSVALAALTVGTILSTALLVGPAASAMRLTSRPLLALLGAAALGVLAMWLGIVLAYDSYSWPPRGHGWPVSFFVVTLIFVFYLLSGVSRAWRARTRRPLRATSGRSAVGG
jgi:zinc/manganese transport system permease protein